VPSFLLHVLLQHSSLLKQRSLFASQVKAGAQNPDWQFVEQHPEAAPLPVHA
jgi:hypothetical protein